MKKVPKKPAPNFSLPLYFSPPLPGNLLSHPQAAVVHLSTRHGKWLGTALPATLVYSADLQADRKDDRTGLFGADPLAALDSVATGHSLPPEPIKVRACGCTLQTRAFHRASNCP